MWDIPGAKEVRQLQAGKRDFEKRQKFSSVPVSSDGRFVAAGGDRIHPNVYVWELESGKQIHCFHRERGETTGLAFSRDGNRLASAQLSPPSAHVAPVIIWDLLTGMAVKQVGEGTMYATSLAMSPDDRLLAVGMGSAILVWNLREGKELGQPANPPSGIRSIAVAPDGLTACTLSHDGGVRLWDGRTGAELRLLARLEEDPRTIGFAASGKHLVTVTSGNRVAEVKVRVLEAETGKELRRFSAGEGSYFSALSGDGEVLATSAYKKGVTLWKTATGKQFGLLEGAGGKGEIFPDYGTLSHAGRFLALNSGSDKGGSSQLDVGVVSVVRLFP